MHRWHGTIKFIRVRERGLIIGGTLIDGFMHPQIVQYTRVHYIQRGEKEKPQAHTRVVYQVEKWIVGEISMCFFFLSPSFFFFFANIPRLVCVCMHLMLTEKLESWKFYESASRAGCYAFHESI